LVTFPAAMTSRTFSISKDGSNSRHPPLNMVAFMICICPNTWLKGRKQRARSFSLDRSLKIHILGGRGDVFVAEQDPLWNAGGAPREEDCGGIGPIPFQGLKRSRTILYKPLRSRSPPGQIMFSNTPGRFMPFRSSSLSPRRCKSSSAGSR
jgi:hypothetical protein